MVIVLPVSCQASKMHQHHKWAFSNPGESSTSLVGVQHGVKDGQKDLHKAARHNENNKYYVFYCNGS